MIKRKELTSYSVWELWNTIKLLEFSLIFMFRFVSSCFIFPVDITGREEVAKLIIDCLITIISLMLSV